MTGPVPPVCPPVLLPQPELNSMNLNSLMISKPAAHLCERKIELVMEGVILTLLRYSLIIYKMPGGSN